MSFGIDERDFDVAAIAAEGRGDFVEQSGTILGDQFKQRAVRRRMIVEIQPRCDLQLRGAI